MDVSQETEQESIADSMRAAFAEHGVGDSEPPNDNGGIPDDLGAADETVEDVDDDFVEDDLDAVAEDVDEDAEPVEQVFQAPEHWSSEEKAAFEALTDPEARQLLIDRDAAFQRGYQEKAQGIADITEALEPWKEEIARRGATPAQAIRTLMAAQYRIEQNPAQGILELASAYGVSDQLQQHFAPDTGDDDYTDPVVKELREEVRNLKTHLNQNSTSQEQAAVEAGTRMIEAFKAETGEDGKPLHPHFDAVRELLPAYINQGKSLKEAYEAAVWTVPEFRAANAPKRKESTADRAKRVAKAKRAARGVRTDGKADTGENEGNMSRKDMLRAAFRQHSA